MEKLCFVLTRSLVTERRWRSLLSGQQVEHLPEGQAHLLSARDRRHGNTLWWAPWVYTHFHLQSNILNILDVITHERTKSSSTFVFLFEKKQRGAASPLLSSNTQTVHPHVKLKSLIMSVNSTNNPTTVGLEMFVGIYIPVCLQEIGWCWWVQINDLELQSVLQGRGFNLFLPNRSLPDLSPFADLVLFLCIFWNVYKGITSQLLCSRLHLIGGRLHSLIGLWIYTTGCRSAHTASTVSTSLPKFTPT